MTLTVHGSYPPPDPAAQPVVAAVGPLLDVLVRGDNHHLTERDADGQVIRSGDATVAELAIARQSLEWQRVCTAQGIPLDGEVRLKQLVARRAVKAGRYFWQAILVIATGRKAKTLRVRLSPGMSLVDWLKGLSGADPLVRESAVLRYSDSTTISC